MLMKEKKSKHGIHEPSIYEQDLSVFAEEIGNVSKRRNILNGNIRNKCIDVENVYDIVDESHHPCWAELVDEFGDLHEHKIRGD